MNDFAQQALLADLRGLAATWSTFRDRHGDMASPVFCNGLEECARQLTEALDRANQLADADA